MTRWPRPQVLDQPCERGGVCDVGVEVDRGRPDAVPQPVEQGLVVGQSPEQRLEQVGVGVGHPGHDRAARRVDHFCCLPPAARRRLPCSDLGHPVAVDVDPPGIVDRARVVHGDHRATMNEQIGHMRARANWCQRLTRGVVIPALVRCAHGPLGPRPRPYGPDSLTHSLGLLGRPVREGVDHRLHVVHQRVQHRTGDAGVDELGHLVAAFRGGADGHDAPHRSSPMSGAAL